MKKFTHIFGLLIASLLLTSCGTGKVITDEQGLEIAKSISAELVNKKDEAISYTLTLDMKEENNKDVTTQKATMKVDYENCKLYTNTHSKVKKDNETTESKVESYIWVDNGLIKMHSNTDGEVKDEKVDCKTNEAARTMFKTVSDPILAVNAPLTYSSLYITFIIASVSAKDEGPEKIDYVLKSKGEGHLRMELSQTNEGITSTGYFEFENNIITRFGGNDKGEGISSVQNVKYTYGVPNIRTPK